MAARRALGLSWMRRNGRLARAEVQICTGRRSWVPADAREIATGLDLSAWTSQKGLVLEAVFTPFAEKVVSAFSTSPELSSKLTFFAQLGYLSCCFVSNHLIPPSLTSTLPLRSILSLSFALFITKDYEGDCLKDQYPPITNCLLWLLGLSAAHHSFRELS